MSRVSPLGELPLGWSISKLSDLTTKIGSGATPRGGSSTYLAHRIKYALVRSQCVHDRSFDIEALSFITDQQASGLRGVQLEAGDVLLNITGDGATFGRCCQVPTAALPAVVNQHVSIIRPKPDFLDPGYLLTYLVHPDIKDYVEAFNAGGSRRAITKGHIESFEIALPPIEEQREIASIFGALDNKIELNRRMAATLEEMARALYRSWFVDFDPVKAKAEGLAPAFMDEATAALFPDRFGDDGLPEGWRMGCVTDVFDVVMGQSPPGNTYNDRGEGLPFYQGRTDFGFRFPSQRVFCSAPTRIAPRDSVLLSVRAPVGDLNRAWEECCIGRGVASLSEKEGRNAYGYEALWALSEDLKAYDSEGTVFGAINKNQLTGLSLIIPPKSMRAAFEERVRPMDDRIRNVTAVTRTLTTLRDTLLPKLMSGELRVGEARDQVEEVA